MATPNILDQDSGGQDSSNYVPLQDESDDTCTNGNGNSVVLPPQGLSRLISDKDVCGNCQAENASEESVSCFLCKKIFHALCFTVTKENRKKYLPDNSCSKTFYTDHFSKIVASKSKAKHFGNFCFVCDQCLTDHEQKNAANVSAHVHNLERKISSMESDICTIKNLLTSSHSTTPPNPPNTNPAPPAPSQPNLAIDNPWNDSDRVQKLRHPAAIVIHDDSGENVPLSDLESIITSNSIEANNTFTNREGNIVVTLASQAERTKLMSAIKQDFPDSDIRKPLEKMPTISIAGIKEEITPDKLNDKVMKLYPEIKSLVDSGETFSVLSVRKQRNHTDDNNFHQASIRVSNCIRKLIENRDDYLSIGLYRCKVYDHFYVKRCNNCQKFGHYKAQCKAAKPVCAECSGNHETLVCQEKSKPKFVPSCVNCKSSKKDSQQHTHSATDRSCPAYQAEQNKLKESISYYTTKNW